MWEAGERGEGAVKGKERPEITVCEGKEGDQVRGREEKKLNDEGIIKLDEGN